MWDSTFVQDIFCSSKYLTSYTTDACRNAWSYLMSLSVLRDSHVNRSIKLSSLSENWNGSTIFFVKFSNIRFHRIPTTSPQIVSCVQTGDEIEWANWTGPPQGSNGPKNPMENPKVYNPHTDNWEHDVLEKHMSGSVTDWMTKVKGSFYMVSWPRKPHLHCCKNLILYGKNLGGRDIRALKFFRMRLRGWISIIRVCRFIWTLLCTS
jgi:hypothetical protein